MVDHMRDQFEVESSDFVSVTELDGAKVTTEQLERLHHRYYWAENLCRGNDVLEVACGCGQGLGLLAASAKSLRAGDYSAVMVGRCRAHYGSRVDLAQFDAQRIPFKDDSFDVILIFEALYYVPSLERFFSECRRLLRVGGKLLIATANKDLYDFNPSLHSRRYLGATELEKELGAYGFDVDVYGYWPLRKSGIWQAFLRPAKRIAISLQLIPKTMNGKTFLKRFVFGPLVPMPAEIRGGEFQLEPLTPLPKRRPDFRHKVIYAIAALRHK